MGTLGNLYGGRRSKPTVFAHSQTRYRSRLLSWSPRNTGADRIRRNNPGGKAEAYDNFFPDADEMRVMFQYWEQHTYFGPESEKRIAAAKALVPGGFTGFAEWAKLNWKVNQEA